MDWNPKNWAWPPRILAALPGIKQELAKKLADVSARLRKTDLNDLRRIWGRGKSYARSYYFTTLVLIALLLALPWWDLLTTLRGNLSQ